MSDALPQQQFTALTPENEAERLAALRRYNILDTPSEAAFDRITQLAARLFDIPTALISLVDESRAWFKSCVGFGASEVPRNDTLCSFAVLTNKPLIIPDARRDDRFACNPFVQMEPGVRFYAGAPLLTQDGFNLGTLCLLDSQPRDPLTPEQQATLVDLAAMVVDELELRSAATRVAQVDAALRSIVQGTATVAGDAFFDALVRHFAQALDVDYAYIGLLEGDAPKTLRTIAIYAHGQRVEHLTYPLPGTPCGDVIDQRQVCCYPRQVQAHFPDAPLLKPLAVESYAAIPLFDSSGAVLGLLAVMDSKPLEHVNLAESLLAVFADRVATEINRQQVERERERFFAVTSDLQVVTGADGYFQWVSPSFERLLGWTVEEMISRPWTDFVHPDDINPSTSETDSLFSGSETLSFENRYRHKDGSYRWLLWKAKPQLDEHTIYGTAIDITDLKQAESALRESEELKQRILESSSDCIKVLNLESEILYISSGGCRLLEIDDPLPVLNTSWINFWTGEAQEASRTAIAAAKAGNTSRFQGSCPTFKGTPRWWDSVITPVRDSAGQVVQLVAISRDMTQQKQAEDLLRDSEEMFRRMANHAPFMVWITNPDGYCTYLSQSWYDFTGQTPATGLGFGWLEQTHPDDRADAERRFLEANEQQQAFRLEYRLRGKDNKYIWAIDAASPWFGGDGQFQGFVGSVIDISDRKQTEAALQESESRLRLALESAKLGTWDFNPLTGLLKWDDQCKAMFGLSPESDISYDIFLAGLHPEDRDRTDQVVQHALNPEHGGNYDIEYRTIGLEDGVERWIAAKGKAFFNPAGNAIRFIGTVLNITGIKRAEAEREQLLQREQAARETAEEANRIKDEFLAVLSHELRSPLNPILGWTQLLQKGKLDVARQREALTIIERNAKLQTQLIEDLLDISRIMQGKLSLTVAPVSLALVVTAAVETVRLAAEVKNVQVLLNLTPEHFSVTGDAARLQQVVWNLLTNAVKFTPNGGQVTIELRQFNHLAQIRVTDTGKGIDLPFLPYVFEYFRQADATTTRKFGGLGLGLAIVKQIVEMHGGTVWAESKGENQGAIFTVQIPVNLHEQLNEPERPLRSFAQRFL
ncbi:PAS domain S-box protein [Nodosilinea nodulosa]|uniref:PAS domain S-box protein n=1 Tax=Nodosilinea nodulosa TaxID=416001 RepID=UPI0005952872|nr:PAS domain S-box protein [Nodosilinea nodulosa]